MTTTENSFKDNVYTIVARIPSGRVMTYGQIAALAGNPGAARQVGGLAHFGPTNLPWQRVVNKNGGLASGYYGGRDGQSHDLEAEGVSVSQYQVDVEKLIYWPDE